MPERDLTLDEVETLICGWVGAVENEYSGGPDDTAELFAQRDAVLRFIRRLAEKGGTQ